MSDDLSRIVDEVTGERPESIDALRARPAGFRDIVDEYIASRLRNLGACLATVGRELAAHARWRLTDPEWDAMIDELARGPVRKPDAAEAEADRIAERIIAARKP